MTHLREGAEILVDANQWGEDGYRVRDNKIMSYFVDRKDPQCGEGKGMTLEEFLKRTDVDIRIKEWAKSIVIE